MTTIVNRATPSQQRIMRAVEGAVKNAADAHPEWNLHPNMARSISKRAAGTLSSQLTEGLAVNLRLPSESGLLTASGRASREALRSQGYESACRRGSSHFHRRSPLKTIWKDLSKRVGAARRSGQNERAEAFVEVLRLVASMQQKY